MTPQLTELDYAQWRQRIEHAMLPIQGVTGIDFFGSVTSPGISDLDFWILFDDTLNGKELVSVLEHLQQKSPIDLDMRPIPEKLFDHREWLLPTQNITSTSQPQALVYLFIWLPVKLAQLLRAIDTHSTELSVLRNLYSFRYTFALLGQLNALKQESITAFDTEVSELRLHWRQGEFTTADLQHCCNHCLDTLKLAMNNLEQPTWLKTSPNTQSARLTMDWATLVTLETHRTHGLSYTTPKHWTRLLKRFELRRVHIELPGWMGAIISELQKQKDLNQHMTPINGPLFSVTASIPEWTQQAHTFGELVRAYKHNNIYKHSLISPLLRSKKPRIAWLVSLIISWFHMHPKKSFNT